MTFEERLPSQTNYMTTSSSFSEDYSLLDRIGDGGYASVFLAVSKKNRFQYAAVKRLSKDRAGRSADSMTERYLQEAQILSTINHPNILHYETCYNEKDYVYIVTEYLTGSDLYMQVTQEDRRLKEKTCRHIIRSLLKAVQYLHQQNIVHRDIKLENIISTIDMKEESESQRLNPACLEVIKLIDFGFAAVADGETLQDSVGTHYYAAPEIYKHEAYGKSVDMWSIGVVTYCLLYGQYPFYSKQKNLLAKQILSAQYRLRVRNRAGEFVSEEVKSFVSRLLVPNPNHRMTVEEALNHPWISQEKMSFGAVVKVIQAVKKFKKLLSKRRSDKSKEETIMEIDIPIKTYEDDRASSVTTIDLTDSAETMMSPILPFAENHSLISEISPVDPSTFKITIQSEPSTSAKVENKSTSTHTISYSGDVVWEIGGVWGNFKQRMRDALYSGFSQIR